MLNKCFGWRCIRATVVCRKTKILFGFLKDQRWRNILFIYIMTFGILVPIFCKNIPHTPFERLYARNKTQRKLAMLEENNKRYNQSVELLTRFSNEGKRCDLFPLLCDQTSDSMNSRKSKTTLQSNEMQQVFSRPNTKVGRHPLEGGLAITIVTVSRSTEVSNEIYSPNYLTQTVAAFLKILNTTSTLSVRSPIYLSVCNVDSEPQNHHEVTSLPKWLPVFQKFSQESSYKQSSLKYDAYLDKEKEDYVYCLDQVLKLNTSYVMLVEDDSLPFENVLSVLERIAISRRHLLTDGVKKNQLDDVTYIKLYHPERLIGFIGIEQERIPELLAIALIFTSLFIIVDYHLIQKQNEVSISTLQVLFIFIYFILLVLSIGRSNICELRRVSNNLFYTTPAPSCCTPAMLFPRKGAERVSEYLKTVTCKKGFAKDTALEKMVKDEGLQAKLVQPNLFKHIGHFSSLRKTFLNPFIV